MHNETIFPSALIQSIDVTRADRVLKDEFESGATDARSLWPAAYLRRKFSIQTTPLTFVEYRWLRSFYSRKGTHSAFFIRDNLARGGNARVRFSAPLREPRDTTYQLSIELEESAATRALPEVEDIENISTQPLFWYDANQERQYHHHGVFTYPDTELYDASTQTYAAALAAAMEFDSQSSLYNAYRFDTANYAQTAINLAGLAGTQPACSLFAIVNMEASGATQVLFSIGAIGAGNALGIALNSSNYFTPWLGGSETWTNARHLYAAGGWISVAVTWQINSNIAKLYINGAFIGQDTVTRNLAAGPVTIAAAPNATLKATCDIAHIMALPANMSPASVAALHNLFAYQFGLPTS